MIPHIIDIEASGFGSTSYPIEIGIVLNSGDKYCSLVKPIADWTHWTEEAERTHKISKQLLQKKGKSVIEVATELNYFMHEQTVYSDGWTVDKPWLIELFSAARVPLSFSISPLDFILNEYQMEHWHSTKDKVIQEMGLTRHRASSDAMIIQETYKRTLTAQAHN